MMKLAMDPRPVILQAEPNREANDAAGREARSLRRSCQDFEAIFIQQVFKAMRKNIPDSGLFERDTAHEIYQDMMDAEVAEEIARQQSLGLAEQMYRQMEKFLPSKK